MKYELLKRTAIALFVGGVISTYAMAEDKPIEAAGNSFVKAIDAEITKQTEAVKTELTNSIAEKADKSAVDDINAELDARAKALKTLQEEKASVKDLNAISENVKEGFNSIQDKVHNLQEALAGDGTEEKPGLIKSVSSAVEELNDNIAKKANQADVEANKAEIAKFGAQTNSNAALLLTMAGKVDQNKKDTDEAIAKNASAIVNIRNKEVLQNARLDNHGERIDANKAAIDELAKATNESVTNLGNAVSGLDEDLAGTQDAVAENRKDIDKNASRITDTRNKQALQNARLDNHGERIEANEAAIDELAKATNESVTNLGNAVSGLDEDLAGTQDAVAENRKDIDANTVAIDKLKETQTYKDLSKVETLVKDKADKTAVEKNASRITDTRNKQALQNARLDNHGERIEANEAAISELAKATDESVKNLGNAVNDLDENLAGTQEAVAENRKDIDKNASRITDTRNKQVLQNARLDNHGERIDANTVAIDKLKETQTYKDLSKVEILVKDKADKTAVEKNASRITDTRNKQVLQNARLDNHGERIEANKAAIGDLATVIDEAVTNLDGVVNDLHGDLSVTKHTVAENRKDIDKNASRITDTRNKQVLQNARLDNHGERIDANKAVIATNKADIATNKADIADSKANIITNRANITANTAAIATHNQRLDHLDNRVNKLDKDLKRGLATQAALTGLFQPYTVGKANFTAAVGGYKSQTAVAIGTGYRYTQNIATKAGVAFTQGGGVTYNAGVNFEW